MTAMSNKMSSQAGPELLRCEGTEAVSGESDSKRPKLSKATQAKLAEILLQLATTAQYSKV